MKLSWLCLVCLLCASSACSVYRPKPATIPPVGAGIVLLGAVQKTGLKAPITPDVMLHDLANHIVNRRGVAATPTPVAREIIGASPHDEMLGFFARHAYLAPYQVQRLMASGLPFRRVLLVRLDSDLIEKLPVQRQILVDADGRAVADRERRTFVVRRTTELSATLLDMRNGRVDWTRQYRVSPEARAVSDHPVGNGFGASVADALANTLTNGKQETGYALAPPSIRISVSKLLDAVARDIPLR